MVFKNKLEAETSQQSKKQFKKLGSLSKHYLNGITHMANDHKAVGAAHHQPITSRLLKKRKQQKSYGHMGCLEVRLAARKKEIKKAQRLRYKVFYKEMSAIPDMQTLS